MKTIYYFAWFWLYQIWTLRYNLKYYKLKKNGKVEELKDFVNDVTTRWGKKTVLMTGSTVEVIGVENIPEENVLFVANHQSYFDIPLLIGFIPRLIGFVAKVELEKVPMISMWMKRLGCIFLDRDNIRASIKTIVKGIDKLKEGESLVVFPEGTRSKSGEIQSFKLGSLKLATKSNVKIVPITIDGTYRMFEEHNKISKSKIKIIIHPPITTKGLDVNAQKALTDIVYETIKGPLL